MAVTATPIFPQTIKNYAAQILPAQTTSLVSLATGGTNGSKIESLNITSTDTADQNIQLWITISSVAYLLGTIPIPATSGDVSSIASIAPFKSGLIAGLSFDSNGNPFLYLASGAVLSIASLATVTTAKAIQAYGSGGDY